MVEIIAVCNKFFTIVKKEITCGKLAGRKALETDTCGKPGQYRREPKNFMYNPDENLPVGNN